MNRSLQTWHLSQHIYVGLTIGIPLHEIKQNYRLAYRKWDWSCEIQLTNVIVFTSMFANCNCIHKNASEKQWIDITLSPLTSVHLFSYRFLVHNSLSNLSGENNQSINTRSQTESLKWFNLPIRKRLSSTFNTRTENNEWDNIAALMKMKPGTTSRWIKYAWIRYRSRRGYSRLPYS